MAISKTGGAFGFLQKSIGGIVYSVSTASIKGLKKQVARSKPTTVKNPRTISQIVQRMKVVPAQKFYEAFEKAAGSVENNPLSHSFQGIAYGNKNKLRFMQLAMQGEPKAYVPKGVTFPAPGVYQVSEGSLPNMPSGIAPEEREINFAVGGQLDANDINNLAKMGVLLGDQLTFVALRDAGNGIFEATFARVIVGVGNIWEFTNDPNETLADVTLTESGIDFASGSIACGAFILSRGTNSSTAKRSTAVMTIAPDYQDLMSAEAYDAAIDSYISGITYNSLNSEWYLNQGSSQAYNGEILTVTVPGTVDRSQRFEALIGRRTNGGAIVYDVFYQSSDGENKTPWVVDANGAPLPTPRTTLAKVKEALGNVNMVETALTEAQAESYIKQLTGK